MGRGGGEEGARLESALPETYAPPVGGGSGVDPKYHVTPEQVRGDERRGASGARQSVTGRWDVGSPDDALALARRWRAALMQPVGSLANQQFGNPQGSPQVPRHPGTSPG